jgi:hypothetical protein
MPGTNLGEGKTYPEVFRHFPEFLFRGYRTDILK